MSLTYMSQVSDSETIMSIPNVVIYLVVSHGPSQGSGETSVSQRHRLSTRESVDMFCHIRTHSNAGRDQFLALDLINFRYRTGPLLDVMLGVTNLGCWA